MSNRVDFLQIAWEIKPKNLMEWKDFLNNKSYFCDLDLSDQQRILYCSFMGYKREMRVQLYLLKLGYKNVNKSSTWMDEFCKVDLVANKDNKIFFIQVKSMYDRFDEGDRSRLTNYANRNGAVSMLASVSDKRIYCKYLPHIIAQ